MENMANEYLVEALDETGGLCDCCGNASRSIWGLVHSGDRTVAAYWLYWTVGHLDEAGANLDMVIGPWGDGTTANDRFAASLLYREPVNEALALMVIDATGGRMPIVHWHTMPCVETRSSDRHLQSSCSLWSMRYGCKTPAFSEA